MVQTSISNKDDNCIPCLKAAKIVVPETQSTFRCTIRNLCFMTATLELEHYIDLPELFLLSMNRVDYEAPIKCKIQNRKGNHVTVCFV